MQRLNAVKVSQAVPELLQAGLDAELSAVEHLRASIEHCARVGDYTTRAKFEEMIQDVEAHVDWFETQLQAIGLVGLDNYLSQHISGA